MKRLSRINRLRLKYAVYAVMSATVATLPTALLLVLNWGKYTGYTAKGTLRLGAGATIALVFIGLKLAGRLKPPRGITLFAAVFGMTYLLEPLVSDLLLLSGTALVGETVDWLFVRTALTRTREKLKAERTTAAAAEQLGEIMQKYTSGDGNERKA